MAKHEKNQKGHLNQDQGYDQKSTFNKNVSSKQDSSKIGSSREELARNKSITKIGKSTDASDYGKEETSRDKNNKKW